MLALLTLLLPAAWCLARVRVRRSLPRIKWLLLATALIYGWTTPGEYIWASSWSPTQEGIELALDQILRLSAVILSLQIVLHYLSRRDLVIGLVHLLWPLSFLRVPVERFAVRLALTIEAAEQLLETRHTFAQLLAQLHAPSEAPATENQPLPTLPSLKPWQWGVQCLLLSACVLTLLKWN